MLVVRVPRAVRGLVVAHEEERLVLGPVLEEVDRQIGDDVGHVALDPPAAGGLDEVRVVIDALARQDRPAVEAGRVAAQVPLADHARMVARRLQVLGDGRLRAVEAVEHRHAVLVAVLAGQDAGPAGRADRVDAEAGVETHALLGEAVEVRRLVDPAAIGADGVCRMVVGHDIEDVGPRGGFGGQRDCGGQREDGGEYRVQTRGSCT